MKISIKDIKQVSYIGLVLFSIPIPTLLDVEIYFQLFFISILVLLSNYRIIFRSTTLAFSALFLVLLYFSLFRGGSIYGSIYTVLSFSVPFFLYYESSLFQKELLKKTTTFFVLIFIPGTILYFISLLIDLPSLYKNGYYNYIFFVTTTKHSIRYMSFFTEPGILGTITFLILLFNRFDFTNKKLFVILLNGVLSFSLFFYVAFPIAILLHNLTFLKKQLLVVTVFAIILFLSSQKQLFHTLILERLEYADGNIAGNNRTSLTWDYYYNKFLNKNDQYLGKGADSISINMKGEGTASYQLFIYKYGYLGIVLIYIYLFILMKSKISLKESVIILISITLMFYTRPYITSFYFLILFTLGINSYYLYENSGRKKLKTQ